MLRREVPASGEPGEYQVYATTTVESRSYVVTDGEYGDHYEYAVRHATPDGAGGTSDPVSFRFPRWPTPLWIEDLRAEMVPAPGGESHVRLEWDPPSLPSDPLSDEAYEQGWYGYPADSGVTGYRIRRVVRDPGGSLVSFTVLAEDTASTSTSYLDYTPDEPGAEYEYGVVAINPSGFRREIAAHSIVRVVWDPTTWDPPALSVDREYSTSTGLWNLRFSWTTDRDDLKSAVSMHVRHVGSGEEYYEILESLPHENGDNPNIFVIDEGTFWKNRYLSGQERSQLTTSEIVIGFRIIGEEPQRIRYSTPVELSLLDWPWVAPQLALEKTGTNLSLTWTSNRDYLLDRHATVMYRPLGSDDEHNGAVAISPESETGEVDYPFVVPESSIWNDISRDTDYSTEQPFELVVGWYLVGSNPSGKGTISTPVVLCPSDPYSPSATGLSVERSFGFGDDASATLTWTAPAHHPDCGYDADSAGVTGYEVLRREVPASGEPGEYQVYATTAAESTSYVVTDGEYGDHYEYAVRHATPDGAGETSDSVSFRFPGWPAPLEPVEDLLAEMVPMPGGESHVRLEWGPARGVCG